MAERRLALTRPAAQFVRGGGRDVDAGRLVDAGGLTPGEVVRIADDADDELGLAIADPENARLRVMATPADGFTALGGALYGWRVERALAWRRGLGLPAPDACYRLVNGAGDGLPGLACDVLGRFAVLWAYGAGLVPTARAVAEAVRGFVGLDGVVVKLRRRGNADAAIPEEIIGGEPPAAYEAREHDVPFEIHPRGATNVGLFTDMREHRGGIARLARGARVLNLFSYTGALGLAAARAGAAAVTNVDTSAGVHAWARGNFRRSGLDDDTRWRFETGDAIRFLARASKDRERYDLVIVDPPTFSPARGTAWSLERDYPALVEQAARVIAEGGVLWLAANSHELASGQTGDGSLARLAAQGVRAAGRTASIVATGGLPADYPTLLAQPRDRYLQIVALRLA